MTGRKVSQYEILDRLGAGGMGEIYRARDTRLNRLVAIKVLPNGDANDEKRRRRFMQEAQAASGLNHPNIITVHDVLADEGTDLLVMELITGQTIADLIPESGMLPAEALNYAVQMAGAFAAAHAAGIVHRDIKPGNVMVTGTGLVKVLDFGLAKATFSGTPADYSSETLGAPLTVQGTVIGTVNYMSPEQAEGKNVDVRSDIFSFGILLYEMVTGRAAFASDSIVSTMTAILRDEVQPIRELAPNTPARLIEIIDRCLRKKREDRWQSMDDVRTALLNLKQNYDPGTAPTVQTLPVSRTRPKPFALPMVLACIAVLAGALWFTLRQKQPPAAPPASAPPVAASPAGPAGATVLTNDSIVQMVEAKVQPSIIMEHIRSSKTQFDLGTGELIRLTKAGVPEAVIGVMRDPARPVAGKIPAAPPPASAEPVAAGAAATIPAATPVAQTVAVTDGLPIPIELAADIPSDARSGTLLQFRVSKDVLIAETVVIAKGAAVTGEVVDETRRTALVIGRKMTYQLLQADAVSGQKLKLRATPARGSGQSRRPVEAGKQKKSKDVASAAGTEYVAYIDGAQTVTIRTEPRP